MVTQPVINCCIHSDNNTLILVLQPNVMASNTKIQSGWITTMYYTSHPCTPMCRASRVLVKAEAAHRFLVSESHILVLRPDDRGKDDGAPQDHSQKVNWWEELESSHDASQAPQMNRAGGQSGWIGFRMAPWNSQNKSMYMFMTELSWGRWHASSTKPIGFFPARIISV